MDAKFQSKLILEDEDGLPFTLNQSLVYDSAILNRQLVVPAGFVTDLASIPRPLWIVLPPIGRYDRAAVIHDFLYRQIGVCVDRAEADSVLREAMEVSHVRWTQRQTIYAGVRVGGWVPWHKYRCEDKAQEKV